MCGCRKNKKVIIQPTEEQAPAPQPVSQPVTQ